MGKTTRRILSTLLAITVVVALFVPASADDPTIWTAERYNNSGNPNVALASDLVAGTEMVKVTTPGFATSGGWNGFKLTSPTGMGIALTASTTALIFELAIVAAANVNLWVKVVGYNASGAIILRDAQQVSVATANSPVTGYRRVTVSSYSPAAATGTIDRLEIWVAGNNYSYSSSNPVYLYTFRTGTMTAPANFVTQHYTNKTVLDETMLDIPASVRTSDSVATQTTRNLFAYLKAVGESDYVMWGEQNPDHSPTTSRTGYVNSSGNDLMDMIGARPAVMGFDGLSFFQHEGHSGTTTQTAAAKVAGCAQRSIRWAKEYNGIIHLTLHQPNYGLIVNSYPNATSYYTYFNNSAGNYSGSYGCQQTGGNPMQRILPGGDANRAFNEYLNLIVDYALLLQAQDVSFIFRPFHELNGNFFWWGSPYSSPEGFKNVWRYVVDYMRNKGVHNILYCYNFNAGVTDVAEFESRYPGDSYVDIVSFDRYSTVDDTFRVSIKNISDFADEHDKIAVVAECGSSGATSTSNPGWHCELMRECLGRNRTNNQPIAGQNAKIAFFMVWTNGSYYPYMSTSETRGASNATAVNNFIQYMCNDNASVFADGNFPWSQIQSLSPTAGAAYPQGWIVTPQSGAFLKDAVTAAASLKDISGAVTISMFAGGKVLEKPATLNTATGYYEAAFTKAEVEANILASGGFTLFVDGVAIGQTDVIFGEAATRPANVIDDFEFPYYFGSDLLLRNRWSGEGSGSLTRSLTQKYTGPGSQYGMEYAYTLEHPASGEQYVGSGISFSPSGNWASYNALQFYMKPDGYGQKVVIQVRSGGGTKEYYLTSFAKTTEPMIVTIPFTSFGNQGSGTNEAVVPNWPATGNNRVINGFGLYLNSLPVNGVRMLVNSALYYDDFKLVNVDTNTLNLNNNGIQVGADFKPYDAKAGLKAAIAAYLALNGVKYTPDTWSAAEAAYAQAVVVNADAGAWAVDINAATEALEAALSGLVLVTLKLSDGQLPTITVRRGGSAVISFDTNIDVSGLAVTSAVPMFATVAVNGSSVIVTGVAAGITVVKISDPRSGLLINVPVNVVN